MFHGTMFSVLSKLRARRPTLFARCCLLVTLELAFNLLIWILVLCITPLSSGFAALSLIAWTTGLRHALDADHICAIDNATRRMVALPAKDRSVTRSVKDRLLFWRRSQSIEEPQAASQKEPMYDLPSSSSLAQRRPVTVGLFFSLGHSTIVVVVTIVVAISLQIANQLDGVGGVGGIIGTAVSGSFLIIVAIINSFILARALKARREARRQAEKAQQQEEETSPRNEDEKEPQTDVEKNTEEDDHRFLGFLTRFAMPMLKAVTQPWHMYPIGLLFGLGFDTASTIALLSVAASASQPGQRSDGKVVLLAFLFTAGMTMVDSLDSVLMIYAYAPPSLGKGTRWWSLWEKPDHSQAAIPSTQQPSAAVTAPPPGDKQDTPYVAHLARNCQDDDIMAAAEPQTSRPPLASASTSAQSLSLLLTLLSIVLAFVIGLIQIMGLIASECASCARSVELHEEASESPDAAAMDDGGLAGRWWTFWLDVADQLGTIGAGIVGVFLLVVVGWYTGRWMRSKRAQRKEKRQSSDRD